MNKLFKQKKTRILLITTSILLLASMVSYGRVFWRWSAGSNSTSAIENVGGKSAYKASLNINGANGHLTVFSFDESINDVVRNLKRTFDAPFKYAQGTMATALFTSDNLILRFIVIQPEGTPNTILFKIEQPKDEYEEAKTRPPTHLMKQIPAFPGSDPVFYAEDKNTGMCFATSKALSNNASVLSFFESNLSSSGWSIPLARTGNNMRFFVRGPEIACVFVDSSQKDSSTNIALLYKRQGTRK